MKRVKRALKIHFEKYQYHYVCTLITFALLYLGVFHFPNWLGRLVESGRDFGLSVAYAFCDLFDIENSIVPTVNKYPNYDYLNIKDWVLSWFEKPTSPTPSVPSAPSTTLPSEWELFKAKWALYWKAFVNKRVFFLWLYHVVNITYYVTTALMYGIPLWFLIKKLFNKFYFREKPKKVKDENGDELYEQPITDSKPLKAWQSFYFAVPQRVESWFVGLFVFVKERAELWQFWALLLLLYFNVFTIILEFIAYYLYFAVEFDFLNLYRQVYKLLLDLYPFVSFAGVVSWITLIILCLKKKNENLEYEQMMSEGAEG